MTRAEAYRQKEAADTALVAERAIIKIRRHLGLPILSDTEIMAAYENKWAMEGPEITRLMEMLAEKGEEVS